MPTGSTKNFNNYVDNVARGYASLATRLAKQYAPNNHLRNSIRSTVEQTSQGKRIIRVRAFGPDARAREYGSGIWARRGPKGKILITPKRKKALVFPWEVATSPVSQGSISPDIPRTADGRVILKRVEHPGVEAANEGRGYIGPALVDARKALREKTKREGTQAIKLDMRAAFVSGGAIVK